MIAKASAPGKIDTGAHSLHRNGVGASHVGMPKGPWRSILEFLVARFPSIHIEEWQARLTRGDVLNEQGQPYTLDSPYPGLGRLYYFRAVPVERKIPFAEQILFEDERILVVDKPHFLPVVPAGHWLQESLLIRLKNATGCMDLVPAHRIDQDTAGLVLFTKQHQYRNAYQALFRERQITKTYNALVHSNGNEDVLFPTTYRSRLVDSEQFMTMQTQAGTANAETEMHCIAKHGQFSELKLIPKTGLRHQLRAQLAALGLPIVGDRIYPTLMPAIAIDDDAAWLAIYQNPLRLLAQELHFVDPVDGQPRHFKSQRQLRLV